MKRGKSSKILTVVLCVMMVIGIPAAVSASARDAAESVVIIYTEYKTEGGGSQNSADWGTGFAIGENNKPVQYIATSYSNISNADKNAGEIEVYFSVAANRFMRAEVYWKDEAKDIALLKLPEATDERKALVIRMNEDVELDDAYSALGYPASAEAVTEPPRYDVSDVTVAKGNITRTTSIDQTDHYEIDIEINEGNIGGPLVNSKGEVVGINTVSADGTAGNKAVAIDEMIKNIDRNIVAYSVHGELTTEMLILIIGGALLLLIVIAIIVVTTNKRSRANAVKEEQANQEPAVKEAKKTTAYVLGLNGKYEGQRIELKNKLVFGRDSKKCNVVFPVDVAGISAVHCAVSIDQNGLSITDLGSSYGTFLGNGTKLIPEQKVRLNNMDKFYLASEECEFEVRLG